MTTLVTGSNGLVGRALVRHLARQGGHRSILAASRHPPDGGVPGVIETTLPSLHRDADFSGVLAGVSVVVHLAARVHVMAERASDPAAAFRDVNTDGTLALARQAAAAGARRFVFVSTVKVNGEHTRPGQAFHHDDAPAPQDPYGRSKHEAETGLRAVAASTGMEVVTVRPPLVYGPGVRANFAAMVSAVRRGLPLPLGSVTHNRRSLVALDNLVDLLTTCIDHPAAAGQTFLVSDGEDLSTTDLLRRLGVAMNRPARLLPMPASLLQMGATMLGRRALAQRLLGNLQVDITHTRETLAWTPPITVDEGLWRAVTGQQAA